MFLKKVPITQTENPPITMKKAQIPIVSRMAPVPFDMGITPISPNLPGKAKIPNAPFEQPDGTSYRLDRDYSDREREPQNPTPGPIESTGDESLGDAN